LQQVRNTITLSVLKYIYFYNIITFTIIVQSCHEQWRKSKFMYTYSTYSHPPMPHLHYFWKVFLVLKHVTFYAKVLHKNTASKWHPLRVLPLKCHQVWKSWQWIGWSFLWTDGP
jgi:hypothetical protein